MNRTDRVDMGEWIANRELLDCDAYVRHLGESSTEVVEFRCAKSSWNMHVETEQNRLRASPDEE